VAFSRGVLFSWLVVLAAPGCAHRAAARAAEVDARPWYFVMVDRFANGDRSNDGAIDLRDPQAFHGGDLRGLIEHLDELRALGVGTVWVSPVFAMRTEPFHGYGAFHGYWTYALDRLEPRFGTVAELRELRDALHARGMRLVLDLVLNHVGPDAPLTREHPEWFHHEGGLEDWNDPVQLTTHDVQGLPDLAQERPEVYAHLLQATRGWLTAIEPDGFRLDAVKHVPLPVWRRFSDDTGVARSGGAFVGELFDGSPATLAEAWRAGGFTGLFDFPLRGALDEVFCGGRSPAMLATVLSLDRLYPDPAALVTLVDNHDLPRLASRCRGELGAMASALTFLYAVRGVPCLTWGTEVPLEGAGEPDNRADMRFDGQRLRELLATLATLRAEHPALRRGSMRVVEASAERLVVERLSEDEAVRVTVARGGLGVPSPGFSVVSLPLADAVRVEFRRGDFRPAFAAADAQWRRGAHTREVQVRVTEPLARVVGSAPEVGGWVPQQAIAPRDGVASLRLPVGAVVELKLVRPDGAGAFAWSSGDNTTVFVTDAAGPLVVDLPWRSP